MNKWCEEETKKTGALLKDPEKISLGYFAERIYEQGCVDGAEIARKLLRLRLGLSVPTERKDV